MYIQITDLAAKRLTESLNDQPGYFKVIYDLEGCGCNRLSLLSLLMNLRLSTRRLKPIWFRSMLIRSSS